MNPARRDALRGAAAVAATAVAFPTIAIAADDPVVALAAERERLHAEAATISSDSMAEALLDQRDAIEALIWSTPATTPAGIAAKLAVAGYYFETRGKEFDELEFPCKLFVSAQRDAERLAGRASS
jgi:hypothetical protein